MQTARSKSTGAQVLIGMPMMHCAEMLHPLPVGAGDYRHRVGGVIAAMGADLLGRVLVDSEDVSSLHLLCACIAFNVELL